MNKSKKKILLYVMGLLIVISAISFFVWNNTFVKFRDDNFEKIVREVINKTEDKGRIKKAELSSIKKLSIDSVSIENIKGIQYMKNLEELSITNIKSNNKSNSKKDKSDKPIDLKLLKNLDKLKAVTFSNVSIKNIDSLRKIKDLTYMNVSNSSLDFNDIKKFKNLKKLVITITSKNKNIDSLQELTSLQELCIESTSCNDISFVKNLKNLEVLAIKSSNLNDVNFINKLKALRALKIINCVITDGKGLEDLDDDIYVNFDGTDIKNLAELKLSKKIKKALNVVDTLSGISKIINTIENEGLSAGIEEAAKDVASNWLLDILGIGGLGLVGVVAIPAVTRGIKGLRNSNIFGK
ncbi:MAG: hypothetical protein MSA89_08060 [Clostridium sp.]|nr:hypothetical protein [Clostridium sp.]